MTRRGSRRAECQTRRVTYVPTAVAATLHARTAAYDIVLLATCCRPWSARYRGGGRRLRLGPPPVRSAVGVGVGAALLPPGVNWAARVLVLVPVLGIALIAMSQGDWSFSDAGSWPA